MKSLVLFYSRTGTTRRLAGAIGEALAADICEIRCPRYGPGAWSYVRAGYDSLKGNLPIIDALDVDPAQYDLVLLGCPVWTSYPATPMRAYLAQRPALPATVGGFVTLGGQSPAAKTFDLMGEALGRPLAATLALKADDMAGTDLKDIIAPFLERLSPL